MMNGEAFHRLAARAALFLSALSLVSAGLLWTEGGAPSEREAVPAAAPAAAMWEFLGDRDALRAAELEELAAVARAPETTEEIRAMAQRRMMDLRAWMEREATVEAVLSARGFSPALVTIHADSANVLLASERVDQAEAAVILELVSRETGIAGGNIKIIPVG